MESLPEKEIEIEKEPVFQRKGMAWKVAFAMMALLVILPNVNATVAFAMYEIPVIGRFFEVVTVVDYSYMDETHEAKIQIPEVIVQEADAEVVQKLNKESKKFVDQIIEEFEANLEEGSYQAVYVDYEVVCDSEKWFTLKLAVSEVVASSNQYFKYYHIDKVTGELVELDDLFTDDAYINAISENIREQMEEKNMDYWTEKADEDVKACYVIEPDQNFYFNENEDLVFVYDKYVVGPGSMGTPEFIIAKEIYMEYMK